MKKQSHVTALPVNKNTVAPSELGSGFVALINQIVDARLAALHVGSELVSQANSPLGRRRHIATAKRLLENQDKRAGNAGKVWYLTRDAVEEELRRLGREQVQQANDAEGERNELADELGLRVVNGGRR